MCSRVSLVLIGVVYICYQVHAADDVYGAELMVESNITLNAELVLSVLNSITDLQVADASGASHTVTVTSSELEAECLIFGSEITCNCSEGYIWSNQVCDTYSCCHETTCIYDVSHIVSFCIPKVNVHVNGTVVLDETNWDESKTTVLTSVFEMLNGFQYLNITGQRFSDGIVEFEAGVSVKFETSRLQDLLTELEASLGAVLLVNTVGMVAIESPATTVCYLSSPVLKCTFDEWTEGAGWSMSTMHSSFELNTGSVVKLNHSCATEKYKSCVAVTLQQVTGIWAGTYECGFISGSVMHTAKTELTVALLPDDISLKINPLSVDCTLSPVNVPIDVTASILNSTESFRVWWSYMGVRKSDLSHKSDRDLLVYAFTVPISCQKTSEAQIVSVTFQNSKEQEKSAGVNIPVIYAGVKFCREDVVNGDIWPKTPDGDTVINQTCPKGRVGFKSRTCKYATWQPVFSKCVKEELNKVVNAADNFLKGLGATQKVAIDIFEGLKNSSTSSDSDSSDSMADISASIDILNVMARASENVVLKEDVFPDFVGAASNMLNKTWDKVNESTIQTMSSNYLESLEGLVKNIKVNKSNGINSQNLELKFCSGRDCNMSVFGIGVNMNKTSGIMKTVAVKNLMDKLKNNFDDTVRTSLIMSVTLESHSNSSIDIRMDFPKEMNATKPLCVFWNTTGEQWSDAGCIVRTSDDNYTRCECNHLTSFSVLMAKSDVSTDDLDTITMVGLILSICSLLIFLIIEWLVWSAVVKTNISYFRHTALVNVAFFLLLADCSFLASTSPENLSDSWCLTLTISKHLFFLAMFSWMLCLSVMLVHQLIFVFNPLRRRVFMFLSSIIGYLCPILMVGSSYVYCKYTSKPYYNSKTCWLVFERLLEGSIHAFLLPVGSITLTNLFSMVVVIVTLVRTSVPDGSKAGDMETAKSILKVVVFLTPVFGVTWTIGFGLLLLEKDSTLFIIANYSFTILNSFQGLLILLTGCLAEAKVREELLKLIRAKSRGKGESMTNSTLTTYTKNK